MEASLYRVFESHLSHHSKGNSMKTFKFPEFFDQHLPAKRYGDWRRALMVNTAYVLIYSDRKDAFEENPSNEFLQKRYSDAIYSMAWNDGWFGAKFNVWVKCSMRKSMQKFWYDMLLESIDLNKGN